MIGFQRLIAFHASLCLCVSVRDIFINRADHPSF